MTKTQQITVAQAQRKVDAIDKRIDAVNAEARRVACLDEDAFDMMTDAGYMAAAEAWGAAWRAQPALREINRTLFSRRDDARLVVDTLAAKEARAADRAEARRVAAEWDAKNRCPTCGGFKMAA